MKKVVLLVTLLAVVFLTAACGAAETGNPGHEEHGKDADTTITVVHPMGETPVAANPQSVVVFDFSTLETLDKLGVKVKGLPKNSLPSHLAHYNTDEYANAGGLMEPDFEAVYGMAPDLIIIANRQSDHYAEFSKIAPTILLDIDTNQYLASFQANATLLGEIFHKEAPVRQELDEIEALITALVTAMEKDSKNGLIVLTTGGKVSAYGPGSRFGILHEAFGIKPADEKIEVSTHGMSISFEYIAETNPDYLFVVDRDAVVEGRSTAKEVIENDLIKNTAAYQNDRIVYLNPNYWYLAGGGLISLNEMINEITALLP